MFTPGTSLLVYLEPSTEERPKSCQMGEQEHRRESTEKMRCREDKSLPGETQGKALREVGNTVGTASCAEG